MRPCRRSRYRRPSRHRSVEVRRSSRRLRRPPQGRCRRARQHPLPPPPHPRPPCRGRSEKNRHGSTRA
ncbi:hypothetical protein ACFPRL_19475 [Pseudoclavibacter helvolus]